MDSTESEFNGTFDEKMTITQRLRKKSELKQRFNTLESDIELLENAEYQYKEVFEWWVVSSWLLEKLKEQGEPILDNDFGEWWGRCTTGQAISLDYVISKIAFDMEILEGQANEWKV